MSLLLLLLPFCEERLLFEEEIVSTCDETVFSSPGKDAAADPSGSESVTCRSAISVHNYVILCLLCKYMYTNIFLILQKALLSKKQIFY